MSGNRIKAIALTKGRNVPSARFRIKGIIEPLQAYGVDVSYRDAYASSYPPPGCLRRILWLAKELLFRIPDIISTYRYDVVIFQRELISTLPTYERFAKKPRVLDVDDAIWMHRRGWAANSIARRVDHIVCGNQYLADYFKAFGKPVTIIPTGVDVDRFTPRLPSSANRVVGWSGTSGGFKYLYGIEEALAKILSENPAWKLRVVSDRAPSFRLIPESQLEFVLWTQEGEVRAIQEMDIGLMPLDDTPWSRGKCSYKMLLYMSCGLPVVVSVLGMNKEVLDQDFVGYGAIEDNDWLHGLSALIASEDLRHCAGSNGRNVVVANYSTRAVAEQWRVVLDSVSESH